MKRHVILVGLPGSGKTTVGRRAAEMLAGEFTDVDEAVEAETGRSITAIFADSGEAEFRRLERVAMDRALASPPRLIAPGAGWIAQPGNIAAGKAAGARILYLRISPHVAAHRLGTDATRPLLAGADRTGRLHALLGEREAWYGNADLEVDAERDVETVAAEVVRLVSDE